MEISNKTPADDLFPTEDQSKESNIIDLLPNNEWRFECAPDKKLTVQITKGFAEIFGTELKSSIVYTFQGAKLAIFSYQGCQISWTGEMESCYTSDETIMPIYLNLHFALENERIKRKQQGQAGPKVLIIGPNNSGKTSLCKTLVSYATKMGKGRTSIAVNLDPQEGFVSMPPGTISAAPINTLLDVESVSGWGSSSLTGLSSMHIPTKVPISYFYGHFEIKENTKYFKKLVARLALTVQSKLTEDLKKLENKNEISSGAIIDTFGDINKAVGYDVIESIVAEFDIDVLVVVGHERLYADMCKRYSSKNKIQIVKIPKAGGVADRDSSYINSYQQKIIHEYFYGSNIETPLSPYTVTVDFKTITIYRIEQSSVLSASSVLPIDISDDSESKLSSSMVTKIDNCVSVQNCVLAILHADPADSLEDILQSSVMGFAYVVDTDETRQRVKLLIPIMGRLPSKVMLSGAISYSE